VRRSRLQRCCAGTPTASLAAGRGRALHPAAGYAVGAARARHEGGQADAALANASAQQLVPRMAAGAYAVGPAPSNPYYAHLTTKTSDQILRA